MFSFSPFGPEMELPISAFCHKPPSINQAYSWSLNQAAEVGKDVPTSWHEQCVLLRKLTWGPENHARCKKDFQVSCELKLQMQYKCVKNSQRYIHLLISEKYSAETSKALDLN